MTEDMHKAHPSRGFRDMPPYRGRALYMYAAYHRVLLLACAIIFWKVVMCIGIIMNISKYVRNDNLGEEVDMAKSIIEIFYQLGDWERRNITEKHQLSFVILQVFYETQRMEQ